jgi:serine kinase of HPr protein (carbohydrate metabolism regulator)
MSKLIVHATSISCLIGDTWQGVLISGPSGVGKSDLALRALSKGCALISDDYSVLWRSGDHLYAGAPDTIKGRIEVRGVGITSLRTRHFSRISLTVHCQNSAVERLPEPEFSDILGLKIPTLRLNPREASSVAKLLISLTQTVRAPSIRLD